MRLAPPGDRSSRRSAWVLLLGLGLVVAGSDRARAQLPAARLYAAFPPGAQAGSQIELTVTSGADIEGLTRLHFSHPEITAVPKMQQAEGQDEPTPVPNQFVVTVAPTVPPGVYDLRAIGNYGITNPRAFVVGHVAERIEAEPNNSTAQATELAIDQIAWGRSDAAKDVDLFRFTAKKDQRLLIECRAEQIDSRLDGTLELLDADGNLLALSRDAEGRDPRLDFVVPADGDYFVRVYDFVFGGSQEHFYRLAISAEPSIDFVFPPAGVRGTTSTYTLYGRNLPNGSPAEGVVVDGVQLDQMQVEIALPDSADRASNTLLSAAQSMLDGVDYRLSTPQGVSNSVWIPFATAAVVVEQEPNDVADASQAVALPCEIAGRFQQPGDEDWYVFEAKKGQVFWLEVFAQRLGQALDPFFVLERVSQNEKGETVVTSITEQDDYAGGAAAFPATTNDPAFRFQVPEDGTYRVMVRDLYHETRGDPSLLYRLSLREPQPDFCVVAVNEMPQPAGTNPVPAGVVPWNTFLYRGGTASLTLVAHRLDGIGGEIVVSAGGLPAGVTAQDTVIGPGRPNATMVFESTADAADWAGPIQLTATAKRNDEVVTHEVRGGAFVWPPVGPLPNGRLTRDIALSVGQQAPFTVTAAARNFDIPQGQLITVPLTLARHGDDQKNVYTLTAAELPDKVVNEAVKIEAEADSESLRLFVPHDAPTGTFTFYVQAQGPVNFTKNADGSDKKAITVNSPGPTVTLAIAPGPVEITPAVPNKGQLKRGAQLDVPVTIKRRNGFAGPVVLDLVLPSHLMGITAEPVPLAADAEQGNLKISASAEATEGTHSHVVVRARCGEGESAIDVHQIIPLVIQP